MERSMITEEKLRAYLREKARAHYAGIEEEFGPDAMNLAEALFLGFGLKSLQKGDDKDTVDFLANQVFKKRNNPESRGVEMDVDGAFPTFIYEGLQGNKEKLIRPPTRDEIVDPEIRNKIFIAEFPIHKYPNLIVTPLTTKIFSAVSDIHTVFPKAPNYTHPDPRRVHRDLATHLADICIRTAHIVEQEKMQNRLLLATSY
jgi:hypothetical protein